MTAEAEAGHITTKQMRHLHALLRDHGISGDKAVHDYLNTWLAEQGEPEVASRKELDTVLAARVIAELEEAEVAHAPTAAGLTRLRAPFDPEAIGKLPRSTCKACSDSPRKRCENHSWVNRCPECGNGHSAAMMHIDFVGHADVTQRLLEVDPFWTWRPFSAEDLNGIAPEFRKGLWIWLTVLGVERPGFGDVTGGKGAKEAIGDALRNAAMRFGVALELWAKGDREWAHAEKTGAEQMHPDEAPPRQQPAEQRQPGPEPPAYTGPTTAQLLEKIDGYAQALGVTYETVTAKWRAEHGGLTLDDLDKLSPQQLAPLETALAIHVHNTRAAAAETAGASA